MENHFVIIKLVWDINNDVKIAGDFNNWNQVSMHYNNVKNEYYYNLFAEDGEYEYKFIINGVWTCSDKEPVYQNRDGYINHKIIVNQFKGNIYEFESDDEEKKIKQVFEIVEKGIRDLHLSKRDINILERMIDDVCTIKSSCLIK